MNAPLATPAPLLSEAPWLSAALRALPDVPRDLSTLLVRPVPGSSNEVWEVRSSGPTPSAWMVKRARHAWQKEAFESAALASRYMRLAGLRAPAVISIEDAPGDLPVQAYPRLPEETLRAHWPRLSRAARLRVLRSWGEMLRRLHQVELPGAGPLARATEEAVPLESHLLDDLAHRLLPAVTHHWPEAERVVRALLEALPEIASRTESRPSVLLHADLHSANVLVEGEGEGLRAVGLLDLDSAHSGPREVDLALTQVLHGPHTGQPLEEEGWFETLREGYALPLDDQVLRFYRTLQLVNLGFYAALTGNHGYAGTLAPIAWREIQGR